MARRVDQRAECGLPEAERGSPGCAGGFTIASAVARLSPLLDGGPPPAPAAE
jgi:hypothetical protein